MDLADQKVIRGAMKRIERKTCLRFQEKEGPLSGHHLLVQGSSPSCLSGPGGVPTFSATVGAIPPTHRQVVLHSHFRVADSHICVNETRGGLLHEMFHVFGVQHEQKRPDRDRYVKILKENIHNRLQYTYDICNECQDYGVPYDCDSIMHSGTETFSTGKPTMEAREGGCDLRWVGAAFDGRNGPDIASKWDWELLRRIGDRLCNSSPSSSSSSSSSPSSPSSSGKNIKKKPQPKRNKPRTTSDKDRKSPSRKPRRRNKTERKRNGGRRDNQEGSQRKKKSKELKPLPGPWRRRNSNQWTIYLRTPASNFNQ